MSGQDSRRIRSFDIAKGIGMLCIIAGHLSRPEVGEVVFSFHVPLFFLIAGYFYHAPKSGVEALKKRAHRLLAPYVMCAVVCSIGRGTRFALFGRVWKSWLGIAKCFQSALYGSGSLKDPTGEIVAFGAAWFLLAIFWALMLYDAICDKKYATPAAILLFVVSTATRKWWLPLSFQAGMCAVIFIHIGHVVRTRLPGLLGTGKVSLRIALPSLLIWLVTIYAYEGHMSMVKCSFPCIPIDFLSAITGTLVVMWVSGMLAQVPFVSSALAWYGENSLTVLCFHVFDMKVIPWKVLTAWLGIARDVVGIPLYATYLFLLKVLWGVIGLFAAGFIRRMRSQTLEISGHQPNRIRSYDIAKGIVILLVVVTHQASMDPVVRRLVFAFHMPFFFLVNAVFISSSYDVRRTFTRSLRSLVLPYAVICLLQILLRGLLTLKNTKLAMLHRLQAALLGVSYAGDLLQGYESVSLIWFVACLFVARNVYVLCRKATSRSHQAVQYGLPIALFAVGCWLGVQKLFLPWSIDVALFAQIFMLLGDEGRKRGLLNAPPAGTVILLVGGIWISLATGGFQIEMATRRYPGYILCVIGAVAGSLMVYWLSHGLDKRASGGHDGLAEPLAKLFVWLGSNSMTILAIHCLRRLWATWSSGFKGFNASLDWIGNAFVEVLFCIAVCYVCCRVQTCVREMRASKTPLPAQVQ